MGAGLAFKSARPGLVRARGQRCAVVYWLFRIAFGRYADG